ncbi:hypothetical protein [Accumulibacter sp.]|uniref:hypothetical protein n=1 Tax=Accumulibacter sp. TaxID=2053492 RepID=UPI002878CC63|nr:hypothetical protein [Accumulibacter sp.]MDS4056359.1 hypothetical protein [Accumulibacter sp.]
MSSSNSSGTSSKVPPVEISNLRRKLNALYEWAWKAAPQPADGKAASGDQRLAGLLGVTPQNIPIWVNGNADLRSPEMLPARHLRPLCEDIFGIPQEIFTGPLQGFQIWLHRNRHVPPLTWRAFAALAAGHPGFHLRHRELPADFLGDRMGIAFAPDEDEDSLPGYRLGDHISIEIDLTSTTDWASRAVSDSGIGLVLLAQDREKTECLCPSARQQMLPGRLQTARTCLPLLPENTPPDKWPRITAPVGRQALYAILSERPLAADGEFHRALVAGVALDEGLLDRYVRWMKQGPLGEWQMFRYRYAVR